MPGVGGVGRAAGAPVQEAQEAQQVPIRINPKWTTPKWQKVKVKSEYQKQQVKSNSLCTTELLY